MKKVFVFVCLIVFMATQTAQAEDANLVMDGFYNGIADIIERNMNMPDNCVKEVDDYYKANQATVEKIRKMTEKPMAEAMAMMQEYSSMSENELETLAAEAKQKAEKYKPQTTAGINRYSEAMAAFTQKYPQHALRIAMKTMQLLPTAN